MVKTCHKCHGYSDDYGEANLRRCAGCRQVYYCSTACQREHWIEHIFDCKPRRPITTADYLARAVHRNLLPEHFRTREDYGFHLVFTPEANAKLLGLYTALIKTMGISPKTIHDWRVRRVLVDEIKASFYKLPEDARGNHFHWFLQNEHVVALAGQLSSEEMVRNDVNTMTIQAWKFIGGSERDSPEEITAIIRCKPEEERDCHCMYGILLAGARPPPAVDVWINFGFASCTSSKQENGLFAQYRALIMKCTFKEFCDAYRTSRLLDLFHSKGQRVRGHHAHLRDLLQTPPHCKKSIWYLKQFIFEQDATEEEIGMHPAVAVDYGFMNCRNGSETRQLWRVYKAFFDKHNGDPLALHEAAMKGNIHGHLSKVVQGLRDPKFQWLMKNPYPTRGRSKPFDLPFSISFPSFIFALALALAFFFFYSPVNRTSVV